MRQVARKGLITMAAASGVLAMAAGYAQADAEPPEARRTRPVWGPATMFRYRSTYQ